MTLGHGSTWGRPWSRPWVDRGSTLTLLQCIMFYTFYFFGILDHPSAWVDGCFRGLPAVDPRLIRDRSGRIFESDRVLVFAISNSIQQFYQNDTGFDLGSVDLVTIWDRSGVDTGSTRLTPTTISADTPII